MIVTDARVAQFVSERIGAIFCPPYTCMGLVRNGEVTAGAVFNQFEHFDVHVTVAGSGWTREFLTAVGAYVFGQLGCVRVTATTERKAVVDYGLRLGGQIEGRMRNHFGPGRDAVVIGILREDYKFGRFHPDCSAADCHFTRFPKEEALSESPPSS